jgi:hypothetical protein
MKLKGFAKRERFSQKRKKLLSRGRGLAKEEKGFAKREKFNQGRERFCQEGEV